MDKKIINAHLRTETGKSVAKRLRSEGRIPAVMYDNTGKTSLLDIDEADFTKLFQKITESTLIEVNVEGGKKIVAFVKDVQYNIISNKLTHVDLYEIETGKIIRTKIRVRLSGSPEGVRSGGVLEAGIPEIEVECLPKDLPERIVVDVSGLQLNHSIHVKDVKVADGVKVLTDPHQTLATLKYIKEEVAAPVAAAEVPAEGAPAAGAATAAPGAAPAAAAAPAAPKK